jgi:hypothetical protein
MTRAGLGGGSGRKRERKRGAEGDAGCRPYRPTAALPFKGRGATGHKGQRPSNRSGRPKRSTDPPPAPEA